MQCLQAHHFSHHASHEVDHQAKILWKEEGKQLTAELPINVSIINGTILVKAMKTDPAIAMNLHDYGNNPQGWESTSQGRKVPNDKLWNA